MTNIYFIELEDKIEDIKDILVIENNIDFFNCFILPLFRKNKIRTVNDLINANIDEVFKSFGYLSRIWKGKVAVLRNVCLGKKLATEECLYYEIQKKDSLESFKDELTSVFYMLGLDNPSMYYVKRVYDQPNFTKIKVLDYIKIEYKSKRKDCRSQDLKEYYINYDKNKGYDDKLKVFSAENIASAENKLTLLKQIHPKILSVIFEDGEIDAKIKTLEKIKDKLYGEQK